MTADEVSACLVGGEMSRRESTCTVLNENEFSFPEAWMLRMMQTAQKVNSMNDAAVDFSLTFCTMPRAIRHEAGTAAQECEGTRVFGSSPHLTPPTTHASYMSRV